MRCTLLISTYNRPDALTLCLESVLQQTVMPYEIVIADDGSDGKTKELLLSYQKKFSCLLKHVWQEDDGYRLAQIRNKAIAASTGDYIIQTDGDLLFHKNFIQDHIKFAKHKCFVSGARANINEQKTKSIVTQQVVPHLAFYSNEISKRYNAFRNTVLKSVNSTIQSSPANSKYVLGCNMAFWKEDLLLVNGYNEEFAGWGKEDNDIAIRLIHAGVQLRFLKFAGIVFHLWHKEAQRTNLAENELIFERSLTQKEYYVQKGIQQYLKL